MVTGRLTTLHRTIKILQIISNKLIRKDAIAQTSPVDRMSHEQNAKYEQYLQSQQIQNNAVDQRIQAKVTNGANNLAEFKGF